MRIGCVSVSIVVFGAGGLMASCGGSLDPTLNVTVPAEERAISRVAYDFIANASLAHYYTSNGETTLAAHCRRDGAWCELGSATLEDGTSQKRLYLHPQTNLSGDGKLAACYWGVTIPPAAANPRFVATVGFNSGAHVTDGVTFTGWLQTAQNEWFDIGSVHKDYTGDLETIGGNLGRWAETTVTICLEASAGGTGHTAGHDWAAWQQARIIKADGYDFVANAATAHYSTTRGKTSFAAHCRRDGAWCDHATDTLEDGLSYTRLYMHPQSNAGGTGKLAACYWGVVIPPAADDPRFVATVGFRRGASVTDGVTFNAWLQTIPQNGWYNIASVHKQYDGRLASISGSVGAWGGRTLTMCLEVVAGGEGHTAGHDWAVWADARITTPYTNPILDPPDSLNMGHCGDPSVVRDGSTYYATCTAASHVNNPRTSDFIPIFSSTDLSTWTFQAHAFDGRPTWTAGPTDCFLGDCTNGWAPGCPCYDEDYSWGYSTHLGAPDLQKVGSTWVLYYQARRPGGKMAIARATASSPLGPYVDMGPLVEPEDGKSVIDPSLFVDDDKRFLYWKHDLNDPRPSPGTAPTLYGRRLNNAGTGWAAASSKVALLTAKSGSSWERQLIEGPQMVKRGTEYHLYYAGAYGRHYGVGYAWASSPLGRFTRGSQVLWPKDPWVWVGHGTIIPLTSNGLSGGATYIFQGKDTSLPRPHCWHRHMLAGDVVFDLHNRPTEVVWDAGTGVWDSGGCGHSQ